MSKPGLSSFPVLSAADDVAQEEAQEQAEAEIHKDENVSIKVTQNPGFLCHIEGTAAIRMPAHTLFKQVITHPDNAAIFRHMDRCSYRRVVSDDGRGRRRVRVAHDASWRFLFWRGTFTTKLVVDEDDEALVMNFQLDPDAQGGSGIMKRFHGRWTIRPHPKDPHNTSLSTLDQDLALGVYMPPPFDRILKRISCNQVKKIFEDVQREAAKVNSGKPTLCPWEEVKHKQFGGEQEQEQQQEEEKVEVEAAVEQWAEAEAALAASGAADDMQAGPSGGVPAEVGPVEPALAK